ncbi:hypothetical protein Tco_0509098, partial [Tanacetum coccineum]
VPDDRDLHCSDCGWRNVLFSHYLVMSSASSAVTYTSFYTDSEPGRVFWGADEEIYNGGIPRVIVYGYDGLPMQPVPHHQRKHTSLEIHRPCQMSMCFQLRRAITSLDLPAADSPGDEADDEAEDEEDEEEEEEHLAPTDSAVVIPTVKPDSPPEGIEPIMPPPSTDISTTGARITVWLQASISLPPEAEVKRHLASLHLHHHHLSHYHHPLQESALLGAQPHLHIHHHHQCHHHYYHHLGVQPNLDTQIASTQSLNDAVYFRITSPPLNLPTLPPSLYIPPPADRGGTSFPSSPSRPPRKGFVCHSRLQYVGVGESPTAGLSEDE